jgi:putative phage-type endonuclease
MKLAKERRIGATDASKLLGMSKYGGPLDVYNRIVLGIDTKSNPRMERGKKYEPEVRRRYVEQTGAELQQFVMPLIVEHPQHPFATCSPDDITVDDVLCEYKTTSRWARGWEPVPVEYAIQVQWSLWVTGLERAHLYAAFGEDGDKTRPGEFFIERCQLYEMRRDDELAETFAEVGERFWRNHIIPRIPPTAALAATEASP